MSDRAPPKSMPADGEHAMVPDLDLPGSSPMAAAPARAPQTSTAPVSGQRATAAAPGRSIALDAADDDDDMQIERNTGGMQQVQQPMSTSARASRAGRVPLAAGRASGAPRVAGTGLELGAPVRAPARRAAYDSEAPTIGVWIAGYAAATLVAGGTAAGLVKVAHRANGVDVTAFMPHAFDGSSAMESGVVALVSLGIAVAIGFIGLRLKPHAWAIVGSAGAVLLLALAMVTVTLASSGENPTPPDGVLLVPYLLPPAVLLLALGMMGRAGRRFAKRHGAARAAILPIAVAAGALAFAALEVSRLGHTTSAPSAEPPSTPTATSAATPTPTATSTATPTPSSTP